MPRAGSWLARASRRLSMVLVAVTLAASATVLAAPRASAVGLAYSTSFDRGIALSLVPARLSTAQFACLNALWTRESNWRWWARNRRSGAYGIPQAYPAWKMARAGADWRTNPATQIRWGLGYIHGRYGTACAAWRHERIHGWY